MDVLSIKIYATYCPFSKDCCFFLKEMPFYVTRSTNLKNHLCFNFCFHNSLLWQTKCKFLHVFATLQTSLICIHSSSKMCSTNSLGNSCNCLWEPKSDGLLESIFVVYPSCLRNPTHAVRALLISLQLLVLPILRALLQVYL